MSKTYGVGIIGAGVISDQHAMAVGRVDGRARLVAVADVDEASRRALTDRYFVPVSVEDYRELLARDDVDLVNICTPPSLHEQMVVDALEAGKHVVCEKPLAHTLVSCDRILDAAERHRGRLGVVHQLRFTPAIQRIVMLCDRGDAGRLVSGLIQRSLYLGVNAGQRKSWWGCWGTAGGGAAMTQFIHELDLLLHIIGPAAEVTASMDTLLNPIESEDFVTASIRFTNGAAAQAICNLTVQGVSRNVVEVVGQHLTLASPWRIAGRDRGLVWKAGRAAAAAYPDGAKARGGVVGKVRRVLGSRIKLLRPRPGVTPHARYLGQVFDAMDRGEPLPVAPSAARAAVELCVAIYLAAIEGRTVTLPLDPVSRFYGGITTADYDGRTRVEAASAAGR